MCGPKFKGVVSAVSSYSSRTCVRLAVVFDDKFPQHIVVLVDVVSCHVVAAAVPAPHAGAYL